MNNNMTLINRITAAENMQAAWQWLESRRKDSHYNNDYWHLRHPAKRSSLSSLSNCAQGLIVLAPVNNTMVL